MKSKLLLKGKISRDMIVDDIFQKYPMKAQKLSQVMKNAGLNCVGCSASTDETIEQGILGHGMEEKDLLVLIDDLNEVLKEDNEVKDELKEGVGFTDFAAEKCKSFRKDENDVFNISLNKGSCGWTYGFKFKKNKEDGEIAFEDKGIKITINQYDLEGLKGIMVDYVDGLQGAGFKISNPNVKGSCGCGSSVVI
jgi:iron-sulfur cluster assembly accessory protein|tara:strand:+ start:3106 stop:3687 length:582 start_codon:yes stop_codon:yes gene_type:complete